MAIWRRWFQHRVDREAEAAADLDREIRAHLDLEAEDQRARGLSDEDARYAARRDLGHPTRIHEAIYEMRRFVSVGRWWRDARHAARALRRSPAYACVTILTLGLGIGATTAIYTIANRALLQTLPVDDPARLVQFVWEGTFIGGTSRGGEDTFAHPLYRDLAAATPPALTGIAARRQEVVALDRDPGVERAMAELVSGNYFEVLGVRAALGRLLTPADDETRDAEPYVVISDVCWRRLFGADPSVINRVVRLNGTPVTIVGVTERGFSGFETLAPSDVFVPIAMKAAVTPTWDDRDRRNSTWLKVFARLSADADMATAQNAMTGPFLAGLRADLAAVPRSESFSDKYLANRLVLQPASHGLRLAEAALATPIYLLLAMAGTLLLIGCVNVANLVITRSARRAKETAIRASLGAPRSALIRLALVENLWLAAGGGAVGLVLSGWLAGALVAWLPNDQIARAIDVSPDWGVGLFALGISALTALVFGVVPSVRASSVRAPQALHTAGGGALGRAQARLRRGLVVAQVALSLVLLVGAGLFSRSIGSLLSVDTGMKASQLVAFSIDPSQARYTADRTSRLLVDVQRELRRQPGLASASAATFPLLAGDGWQNTIGVEGHTPTQGEDMQAGWNQVLPDFFSTLGVPLLAGREFTETDAAGAASVVMVNETFANRFFGSASATVGRHLVFGGGTPTIEIVGVVRDLKHNDLDEPERPWTFTPVLQARRVGEVTFYALANAAPEALLDAGRRVVSQLDPGLPVFGVRTLQRQMTQTHFTELLIARLSSGFAMLATLLAGFGLYGVTAFAVARRTPEIGLRLALGAARGRILRLVLGELLTLTAVGAVLGVPLAIVLGRLVESQLFGVRASDPAVTASAVAVLSLVALAAGYLPARRALRIDPMRALRQE